MRSLGRLVRGHPARGLLKVVSPETCGLNHCSEGCSPEQPNGSSGDEPSKRHGKIVVRRAVL
ncbi:MAG: hypothetical protein GDYSWBUE_001823 [Candidatus Fervidibacterota bacterium]